MVSSYTLFFIFILLTSSATSTKNIQANEKFNILLVMIDDLRYMAGKTLYLPSIQKIADNGIQFSKAFAQQALCAPSRNSILTGRRPDSLRLYDFYSYWRDDIGDFTTIPQFFKERGYNTYSIGKIFHPGISSNYTDDYPYSWSEKAYHPPSEKYKDAAICKDKITKKLRKNLLCPIALNNLPEKTLPDIQSLEYAAKLLKYSNGSNSKPIFLAIGFHKPHIPFKFPKQFLEGIPANSIKLPKVTTKPDGLPLTAWHPWTDVRSRDDIKSLNISFPLGTMPPKWTKKIIRNYYAAALYVDSLIGTLMDYVDKQKTIIVVTSDHGWSLGENGLWAKYSNFDNALRVPLIFHIPGKARKIIDTPIELIDLFPTLVEMSGFNEKIPKCLKSDRIPLCFEGKSLMPLMENKEYKSKSFAISQYPRPSVYPQANSDKPRLRDIKIMGYSIRTNRYRYTEWIKFNHTTFSPTWDPIIAAELYDHKRYSEESNNLYWDKSYRKIIHKLSFLLRSQVNLMSA